MSEKKITKAQHFEDILSLLHGENPLYGTDMDSAEAFIKHEIDLLKKKNSADRKETPAQKANREFQKKIVEYLQTQTEGRTAVEIGRGVPELREESVNRIVGLLRGIVRTDAKGETVHPDAPVVRITNKKGQSLFSIADGYNPEEGGI